MRQINQNILKIKDPSTGEFKTIPNLMVDNSDPNVYVDDVVNIADVAKSNDYNDLDNLPDLLVIDDAAISAEDTWSSQKISGEISDFINIVYPVGSIYMSVNAASPATLFGGQWEQIKDTFLLSAGDTYAAGTTGGEAEHTLTIDEMPSHSHVIQTGNGSGGSAQIPTYTYPSTVWSVPIASSTGGDIAHNNMPPYLAVYVWKRTA